MARRFTLRADDAAAAPRLTIDYAAALNAQQLAAATAGAGPVLIIAGAGSGKTRTLIYRVAYLVETGALPEQIVLLTFTRRAARQMVDRASGLLDGRCARVEGGTFHSFCAGILRRHGARLGYPSNFTILDASDAADVIDMLRTERGLHRAEKRFPRKKALQALLSEACNRDLPLAALAEESGAAFAAHVAEIEALAADYRSYKAQHGLADYDDLLVLTLRLLTEHDDARRLVAGACRHVLVDEYQDTNRLQAQLVQRFAGVHGNVTAVGDDAQSIYGFRGADYRNILGFPEAFPGAQLFKLEQNYRSTQPILALANEIIGQAAHGYRKRLFSARAGGDLPALVPATDSRTESRFVAQTVLALREEGAPLGRIAVLFRSSYNAFDLELELNRRGVPFVKHGGMRLAEAAHIKDVVGYLRVLENPRDAVAWMRLLQLLEGVGPKTAQQIAAALLSRGDPFAATLPPAPKRAAEALGGLLGALRPLAAEAPPVAVQIERILAHYLPALRRIHFEDYPRREQDLEHLAALAGAFPDRTALLTSLSLDPIEEAAGLADPAEPEESPLVLSTIHSAKGLEYHTVFLIHALDGVLPSAYALADDAELDEERRLFYVAVTRAETNLFITYPIIGYQRGAGAYLTRPSRFVTDLPETVLERCGLDEEGAG